MALTKDGGRRFTASSANRALPYVRAIVADIAEAMARLDAAAREQARLWREDAGGAGPDLARDAAVADAARAHAAARTDLVRLAGELDRAGVMLKDPRRGLVDFPAEMDGRPVLLCWRRGEDAIAWWHDEDAGFRGRRPLPPADGDGGGGGGDGGGGGGGDGGGGGGGGGDADGGGKPSSPPGSALPVAARRRAR